MTNPTPPPPSPGQPHHLERFFVHQKVTPMVNRYRILAPDDTGQPGDLIAFAEQKRLKLKEEVFFFNDETKTILLFSLKSRQVIDMHARTDILNDTGNEIGWFEKDFATSLTRSTWHLHYAGVEATGTERSTTKAIVRRVLNNLPLRFHFDFADTATGEEVLAVERQRSLRDRYHVTVADPRLDYRIAAAMAVALDIFQGR